MEKLSGKTFLNANNKNREIYKFYRELIKFKERGAPREMLKSINPLEASLIDAASGAHVRFRLGGSKFPPTVFYKIFVHAPVVDINAFAPRDYTRHKKKEAIKVHSKGYKDVVDKTGWYERDDRNDWRPVTERLFYDVNEVVSENFSKSETIRKRMKHVKHEEKPIFHYSRMQRKTDVQAQRKKKKLEWMKKMYQQTKERPASAGKEDVDDLLNWSQELDYDKYVNDWLTLATTLGSDYSIPKHVEQRQMIYEDMLHKIDAEPNNPIVHAKYKTPTPDMDPRYRFSGAPVMEEEELPRKEYSAYSLAVDEILSGDVDDFENDKQDVIDFVQKQQQRYV